MRVLLLTHRVPFPPNRGDRIRAYHLLRYLSARHEVSLGALTSEAVAEESRSHLESLTRRLAIVPQGRIGRWASAAWSFARGRTATAGLFDSDRLRDVIARWRSEAAFDCVIAYCSSMATYAFEAFEPPTRVVVDLVDVDSQKWFDYQAAARGAKRWLYGIEGRRLRHWESQIAQRADRVVLVSEAEGALFHQVCPTADAIAIGNGVDIDYFHPHDAESAAAGAPNSCVFLGALDYLPNIDAMVWFCEQVWPLVRAQSPHAELTMVGRNPSPRIRQLAERPGVALAADVRDVRPYLDAAQVSIAPLRIARGVQNKVLESLAHGKPTIASTSALTGLSAVPGQHVVKADTAEEWVATLLRLWSSTAERSRLSQEGRQLAVSEYRWEAVLRPWDQLIAGENPAHSVRGAFESVAS